MTVYVCDAIRTAFGKYGGALAMTRPDDLAAATLKALMSRQPQTDWEMVDDVVLGCANQAGEDNRNIARMAGLLAGLPISVGGTTINRLCGSGLDAVAIAARAIKAKEAELMIAGGVESMSRAPFVLPKADAAFARSAQIADTTIGWRLVNARMQEQFGIDSMPETAENVAAQFNIARDDQDALAHRSQQRWQAAQARGFFAAEIFPLELPAAKGTTLRFDTDEHPRPDTNLAQLAKLKPIVKPGGTITAGNASGVNDGAAMSLIASEAAVKKNHLTPRARILGAATIGVEPRIMGIGPAPATQKLLARLGMRLDQFDVIEFNEAFAAQVLAVSRLLGLPDDAAQVNANGGAIAMGHPLGASGTRLLATAVNQLHAINGRYGLIAMCIGVGQGIALAIEIV
ncbi:MAG: 3-oxoadipyl-CoA thiolase [Candidatus Symbiobacter sp.]|nr:3-oxoadipyl-CoA thiolase [Candidatus Symbiobacter sp.]